MIFPRLTATSLAGRRMSLPDDLGSGPAILLVALDASRHQSINSWMPYVKQVEQLYENVSSFELLVLGSANALVRTVSTARLRAAVPNPSTREITLPLYVEVPSFCQALGLPADGGVHVLLLDAARDVAWTARGPVTPDKVQSLAQALADIHVEPADPFAA